MRPPSPSSSLARCSISDWLACVELERYSTGTELFIASSMQLHVRFGAASNHPSKRVQGHFGWTVQRIFVQLVERTVHEASEQALNPKIPAEKPSHQASDR